MNGRETLCIDARALDRNHLFISHYLCDIVIMIVVQSMIQRVVRAINAAKFVVV